MKHNTNKLWQIKTTLAHRHGRAALLRRLLADQQVSPTELAFVPMLIETAINIKNERNIMSTNSTSSDTDEAAVAPGQGHRLPKCKTLLWLALPLTLAVGYASDSNRSAVADKFFTDAPTPVAMTASESHAVNRVVGRGIFDMFLADTNINYSRKASVNNDGKVTLSGASRGGVEQQRVVDRIWELNGVNQLKNEKGVDLAPTPATKAVAAN